MALEAGNFYARVGFMTQECKECKFRDLCIELGYLLDCDDYTKCERYYDFLEGMEEYDD